MKFNIQIVLRSLMRCFVDFFRQNFQLIYLFQVRISRYSHKKNNKTQVSRYLNQLLFLRTRYVKRIH